MELVSIIIPTHNAEKWICETLDSVLAQTYLDFEIIVVDDRSEDRTLGVVREKLARDFAGRWQVIELPGNAGPSAARNVGIKSATGSWLQFLDGDDFLAPMKLQREMEYCRAASSEVVAVYSPWRRFYFDNGNLVWEGPLSRPNMDGRSPIMCLVGSDRYLHGAGLARRSAIEAIGGFDETLRFWECEEINVRLAKAGRLQCVLSEEPLYLWRMHRERVYIGDEKARYSLASVALSWMELVLKAAECRPLGELNLPETDKEKILESCTIWARRLYTRDRDAFRTFLAMAQKLHPDILPAGPAHVSLAARYFGYEGAEAIAWWTGLPRVFARKTLEHIRLRKKDSVFD